MIKPPRLKQNDTVGIVAPARSITVEEVETAIAIFKEWGLQVKQGKHLYSQYHQFAGKDKERAADFQEMVNNPEVRAIFCARGGYGTIKIMEHLDLEPLRNDPKWIVGFSDITVLHSCLNQHYGIQTLHAPMPVNLTRDSQKTEAIQMLNKALFEGSIEFSWETKTSTLPPEPLRGTLTGGNLSVLYSLSGTQYDVKTHEKILFIEDLDEYLYHIDRMLMNFKHSGKLDHIKALLVGGMTEMNDNKTPFGFTAEHIIKNITESYPFPVLYNLPSGHIPQNHPLFMGGEVVIERVEDSRAQIRFIS